MKWELDYWKNGRVTYTKRGVVTDCYEANIDTTIALYPPHSPKKYFYAGIRLAGVFEIEHKPWYGVGNDYAEEYNYYLTHKSNETGHYSSLEFQPDSTS